MSFLAGCLTTATVWVLFLWWRNPHGHRGGQEVYSERNGGRDWHPAWCPYPQGHEGQCVPDDPERRATSEVIRNRHFASLPVRYHRTG